MQPRDFFLSAARLVDRAERVASVPIETFNCTGECKSDDKWDIFAIRSVYFFSIYLN